MAEPTGRALDAWLAEHAMGWTEVYQPGQPVDGLLGQSPPHGGSRRGAEWGECRVLPPTCDSRGDMGRWPQTKSDWWYGRASPRRTEV